jgi:hypothetical protein
MPASSTSWPVVTATVKQGHRVASGTKDDPRFPGGTLAMQAPFFERLGVNLAAYHPGTLNLSIAPHHYQVLKPRLTFRQVQWHPMEPAEDFSFFDCQLQLGEQEPVAALIYYPHPETKPEHFQAPDVLEVLAPTIMGLEYGSMLSLAVDPGQMTFS